jgi:DNA uptake protein ComE-like DNA-binding protein
MSRSPLRLLISLVLLVAFAFRATAEWVELKGCRITDNASNDGDSFHVQHKGREFVFRLYFVDAPETSLLIPDRVSEQADAFKATQDRVLKAGKGAAMFTKKHLRKDFKVSTRWEDARGMSKGGRHYAFVETADGKDLGELLLAAGWARSYGMKAATKSSSAAQLQQRYDRLEQKARRAGVGIWGDADGAVEVMDEAPEEKELEAEEEGAFMGAGVMESALASAAVPATEEEDPVAAAAVPAPAPMANPTPARAGKSSVGGKSKLDLNTASQEELAALPGIGEVKAAAIIAARPFAGSFDLLRVPGITPATLKEIYPLVGE